MGKLFKFVAGLAVTGGALAALTYHLQKKGVVNIEVNYDDVEGNPVTKPIDQIVDEAVVDIKDKAATTVQDLSAKAGSVAKGMSESAKVQIYAIGAKLGDSFRAGKSKVVSIASDAESELQDSVEELKDGVEEVKEAAEAEVSKAKKRATRVKKALTDPIEEPVEKQE